MKFWSLSFFRSWSNFHSSWRKLIFRQNYWYFLQNDRILKASNHLYRKPLRNCLHQLRYSDILQKNQKFCRNFQFSPRWMKIWPWSKKKISEYHVLSRSKLHSAQFLNWCVLPDLFFGDYWFFTLSYIRLGTSSYNCEKTRAEGARGFFGASLF